MVASNDFSVDRQVEMVLSSLTEAEQKSVRRVIKSRQSFMRLARDPNNVSKPANSDRLSLLNLGDYSLLFTEDSAGIQVLDLLNNELLARYKRTGTNGGVSR